MRTSDERKEIFRNRLIQLCNDLNAEIGLSPEDATSVMAEEGFTILKCLAWMPHAQRAAYEHFVCAHAALVLDRVIPVTGFKEIFNQED